MASIEFQQVEDKQSIAKNVENSLQKLNKVTYSPKYVESVKIFAKNIDDQINNVKIFQGLDELDVSCIQDVNPVGKYIELAQEKLACIYDMAQKCANEIYKRHVAYEGEIKKRQGS